MGRCLLPLVGQEDLCRPRHVHQTIELVRETGNWCMYCSIRIGATQRGRMEDGHHLEAVVEGSYSAHALSVVVEACLRHYRVEPRVPARYT
jgi:hypothetical protein